MNETKGLTFDGEISFEEHALPPCKVSGQAMPEAYYEKWEKLHDAEQRAYAKARKLVHDANQWRAWQRAATMLANHENNFLTLQLRR